MKRISVGIVLLMLIAAVAVSVQAQMQMPTPAPELKKFDYFVGAWTIEGVSKPGPMGPGGTFTGTETDAWMENSFFLKDISTFKSSMGDSKGEAFMGYSADDKAYTYHAFDSWGEYVSATGMLDGDTWNWNSESKMGGKMIKTRYIIKMLSPTSYTFKMDMSEDGKTWSNAMEGKATKAK